MTILEKSHQEFVALQLTKQKHYSVENLKKTLNIKGIERLPEFVMSDCAVGISDLIVWAAEQIESQKQGHNEAVTRYILSQALFMCGEQGGEDFAREMVVNAGISIESKNDLKIIHELGNEHLEMVKRFTY